MKKVLKAVAIIAAVGAVIGGVVYLLKKRSIEEDLEDFDEFDDFDDFDDFEEDDFEEEDNLERVYTSINLDATEDVEEAVTEDVETVDTVADEVE